MNKFFIRTFGCKTNQYESELIKQLINDKGDKVVQDYREADFVVINSCAVTQPAERDVYKFIRRVLRDTNSVKQFFLVGCYAEYIRRNSLYDKFFLRLGVNIPVAFLGNKDKYNFISEGIEEQYQYIKNFFGVKRAYVKIQDGCDNFCSYCVVPYLRNNIYSKPINVVLREIEDLVKNGYTEIYLVGTNIGKYNWQDGINKVYDYIDLSEKILIEFPQITLLYTSLEPINLTEKFFEFLNKYKKRIFPHFHIPLQSADNSLLEDMNRKYTVEEFEEKIKVLRKILPKVIISTDVIVGYPKETKEKFDTTVEFIKKIKFNWVHVFPYSPRLGTKSYQKYGNFVCYDAKLRVREINRLNLELGEQYFKQVCKVV